MEKSLNISECVCVKYSKTPGALFRKGEKISEPETFAVAESIATLSRPDNDSGVGGFGQKRPSLRSFHRNLRQFSLPNIFRIL